jgi:TDG/mug DNA glycosylase family protein
MKGKKIFNKNEANQIIQLLKKKIESGNEKKYRDQLRRIGFYISDFGYSRDGFSPDDFEALIASGKIQIIDRETNNKFNKEIKKQESSTIHKISGFPPIVSENSKLLILGTMPSEKSLLKKEYYANPKNQFWEIMENVLGIDLNIKYSERIVLLTNKGIALWDVLQYCQRLGSLDANIIREEQNNFESFLTSYNNIKAIFFNGIKAYNFYLNLIFPYLSEDKRKLPMKQLPSTSPANASILKNKKIEIWKKELYVYLKEG